VLTELKTQMARLDDLVQDYLSLVRVSTLERTPQDLGSAVQAWAKEWQPSRRPRACGSGWTGSSTWARWRCIPARSAGRSSIWCRMRSTPCRRAAP
jgi:hypothetical protein